MLKFKDFINEDSDLDMKLKKLGLKRGGMGFKIGKVIGGEVYLHKQYEDQLPDVPLQNAKNALPKDFKYQVVKFNPKTGTFSFIQSNDFDTNPEPSVNGGITVKSDGSAKTFKDSGWIWHHKWMWVDDNYDGFDVEENKRRSLKWASLDGVDKARIGQRKHWDDNVVPRLKESNMWVTNEDNEAMFTHEYLLSEYIKPRQIDYGTDFINKKWKPLSDGFYCTFFKSRDENYGFIFRNGFVGFGRIKNNPDDYTTINHFFADRPFDRFDSSSANYIFNYVFYIITESIKNFNPKEIYFDADNNNLKYTYDYIMKNKFFKKQLENIGYEFIGKTNQNDREFYTFKRIT